jgi:hypothetical protein
MHKETALIDFWNEREQEWIKLNDSEKRAMLIYRRKLISDSGASYLLMTKVNDIHKKYPEFDIGCIPTEGA